MDGITFTKNLHDNIAIKRRQSKQSIQIGCFHYMLWALRKKEIEIMIENSHSQYSFVSTVLKADLGNGTTEYKRRALIKYKLTPKEFCDGLKFCDGQHW